MRDSQVKEQGFHTTASHIHKKRCSDLSLHRFELHLYLSRKLRAMTSQITEIKMYEATHRAIGAPYMLNSMSTVARRDPSPSLPPVSECLTENDGACTFSDPEYSISNVERRALTFIVVSDPGDFAARSLFVVIPRGSAFSADNEVSDKTLGEDARKGCAQSKSCL